MPLCYPENSAKLRQRGTRIVRVHMTAESCAPSSAPMEFGTARNPKAHEIWVKASMLKQSLGSALKTCRKYEGIGFLLCQPNKSTVSDLDASEDLSR